MKGKNDLIMLPLWNVTIFFRVWQVPESCIYYVPVQRMTPDRPMAVFKDDNLCGPAVDGKAQSRYTY